MGINIPKRRSLSLFDDLDADERHAREMERYREAVAAGRTYQPDLSGVGVIDTLFDHLRSDTDTNTTSPRGSAEVDLAPPVARDNALPEILNEREEDPRDEAPAREDGVVYEFHEPGTMASDAQPDTPKSGDQIAGKIFEQKGPIQFRVNWKGDPSGGRQEHLGPDGKPHIHLQWGSGRPQGKQGPEEVRISSETFRPVAELKEKNLTPREQKEIRDFDRYYRKTIERLTDDEKATIRHEAAHMYEHGTARPKPRPSSSASHYEGGAARGPGGGGSSRVQKMK